MRLFIGLVISLLPAILQAQQYTWNTRPQNMFPDSLHAPFVLGVASSEPGTGQVYIWTYAEPDSLTQSTVALTWQVATDNAFTNVVQSGNVTADSSQSWTTNVLVTGLNANTYYYYRFDDGTGRYSVNGRTRTLPNNAADIKLAVGSCNNPIAFFNAFGRIAERNDLHAVVHLGDWEYDKLNQNRSARYPDPAEVIRCGLDERRKRSYLMLLDPDLRAARQMHPFFYLWDNHDIQSGDPEFVKDTCRQVFFDFTGQPLVDSTDLARQYRKVSLGTMVDLFVVDVQYTQDRRDTINGQESYLGAVQKAWLLNQLQSSTAKWKLVGQQKLITPFSVTGLESIIPGGVSADEKAWEGYSYERTEILELIRDNNIDNVMFLSGDAHFVVVADVPVDPFDSLVYNAATGSGSVCVEFLPSGLSSPNINERGIPYSLGPTMQEIAKNLNPHQQYVEFMDNGYGILEINADSITAQVWLLDAQTVNNAEYLADTRKLYDGENHWEPRNPPTAVPETEVPHVGITALYPNPAQNELYVDYLSKELVQAKIEVMDMGGKVWLAHSQLSRMGTNRAVFKLETLPAASYLVRITTDAAVVTQRFVKQ